jgi:hypothetical protein
MYRDSILSMKICKKCGKEKELTEYHLDAKMTDGRKSFCKACRSTRRLIHVRLPEERKRFDKNLNAAIYYSIKTGKHGTWERIVGYSLEQLKECLEKQFTLQMSWKNFGSCWWIDKIIPRSAFKYRNVNNNELKKCWCLRNLRPLLKNECKSKGDKVKWDLIEKFSLFDILPTGLIPLRGLDMGIVELELERIVYQFVDRLENHQELDKNLYISIINVAVSPFKTDIMHDMIEKIRVYQSYDEDKEKVNFNFIPYVSLLLEKG